MLMLAAQINPSWASLCSSHQLIPVMELLGLSLGPGAQYPALLRKQQHFSSEPPQWDIAQ